MTGALRSFTADQHSIPQHPPESQENKRAEVTYTVDNFWQSLECHCTYRGKTWNLSDHDYLAGVHSGFVG